MRGRSLLLTAQAVLGVVAPIAMLLLMDLPAWATRFAWTLLALGWIFTMAAGWTRPEWRLGDEGPNEFGSSEP